MTATLPQDCCWGIPVVAMCVSFLLCMTQSSTGYLYVLFMEKYDVNRETASWPESIIMLTQNLGGFVVTVLHSKVPIFYVLLFSAALCCAGLVGASFAPDMKWMSAMLGGVYGQEHPKRSRWSLALPPGEAPVLQQGRSFKCGHMLVRAATLQQSPQGTGSGASIISFTVFTMLYFDKYRATATSCNSMGVPYRKTASTERQPSPSKSSKSILEQLTIFRMLAFYVLLIVYALCDCTISMHTTTIVDYGRDKGSALEKAKLVLTYNAAGQFVGRTLLPFASDNVANSRCPFAVACFVGAGAWLALIPVVQSLTAFVALNLVLGVCQGYVTCIRSVLVNDYCGVERLPTFFGILGMALVPLSFSGPTIIGFFRDTLGSYDNFYRMLGAGNICIAALLFVLVWRDKTRRKSCDLLT
ncbi:monocarboxylate transporter 10-like [Rhipicephalus sanguineus]|uniref:monocarboxylate transporter 10-like n=1 Tax=Rhipicephalus sanguineus TaxID=34632 RepID=UPI0020C3E13B|nr:monocarboxylate transporter 10-like [Rhipicephalus sanguineus]